MFSIQLARYSLLTERSPAHTSPVMVLLEVVLEVEVMEVMEVLEVMEEVEVLEVVEVEVVQLSGWKDVPELMVVDTVTSVTSVSVSEKPTVIVIAHISTELSSEYCGGLWGGFILI